MNITEDELKKAGIESVTVNGIAMYKREDRLFLTKEHAFFGNYSQEMRSPDRKMEMDARCKVVPYKQNDDIFLKIAKGQSLIALVKF